MKYALKAILLSFAALLMVSCSKGNEKVAIIDPATGKHIAGWAVATTGGLHPDFFLADVNVCFECHGSDLKGGVSKVSCFTASRSGITCHAGGPPAPHAVPYPNHGVDVASKSSNFCLICHKDVVSPGSTPPGCQNCHLSSPIAIPNGCASCHAKPPNQAVYPNYSGRHVRHASLNVVQNATLTAVCNECHSGLGLGTVDHLDRSRAQRTTVQTNPSPVAFGTLAKTGGLTPAYDTATKTCTNTYCHGVTLVDGTNNAPRWNDPAYLAGSGGTCGVCHGYPPLIPAHFGAGPPNSPVNGCKTCHTHVNPDGNGFDDPTQHINGVIDVFN